MVVQGGEAGVLLRHYDAALLDAQVSSTAGGTAATYRHTAHLDLL